MSDNLVSICIPTYNGEKFIAEAMESALRQTYRPVEIIVSDDDSKDKTLEIIATYIKKTDIPIHIYHHKPAGIGANWNNCVRKSNGQYIKFLFQDDLLDATCIAKMIDKTITDSQIGMVFCKRNILYDSTNANHAEWVSKYGELHNKWSITFTVVEGRRLLRDPKLLDRPKNKIGEPVAVLIKRDVFEKVGYFSTILKQSLDYEYWYRIFKHFKVAYVNESLASFRLHCEQATAVNKRNSLNDTKLLDKIIIKYYYKHLHPVSIYIIVQRNSFIIRLLANSLMKINKWLL